MKLFINNKLTHSQEAMVSIFDHGFLYGIGLFETFRTYNGQPFLLNAHIERLTESCAQLGIAYFANKHQLQEQITELLYENGLTDGYFRLTVSAGEGELGLPLEDYDKPSVILMAKALPPAKLLAEWEKGRVAICLQTKRNSPEGAIRYKSVHYMNNVLAKRELRLHYPQYVSTAEGLMLNAQGYVAEGIVSNIFFRKKDVIYTPAIATGILPGITRALLLKLCAQSDIKVVEGYFDWNTLLSADEIWLTNSIQEIVPVTSVIDDKGNIRAISDGQAGEYTKQLYRAYENYVLKCCKS